MKNKFQRAFSNFNNFIGRVKLPYGLSTWTTFFSLLFILNILIHNSNQLKNINLSNNAYLLFLCAIFSGMLSLYVNAWAWELLIYWLGHSKSRLKNIKSIYLRTNLLKYLPGGIWHFVARLKYLNLEINYNQSIKAVILEPLLMVAAAMLLVLMRGWNNGLCLLCFIPSLIFLPKWREIIVNKIKLLKFNNLDNLDENMTTELNKSFTYNYYPFQPLLIEILFILLRFLSLYFCLRAFSLDLYVDNLTLISTFSLAWTIGLVIPAAPGGIGVFESALIFQIGNNFPQGLFVSALIAYRIVISLSDLFMVGIISVKKIIK